MAQIKATTVIPINGGMMNGLLLVASLFGCVKAKIALTITVVTKSSAAKACATLAGGFRRNHSVGCRPHNSVCSIGYHFRPTKGVAGPHHGKRKRNRRIQMGSRDTRRASNRHRHSNHPNRGDLKQAWYSIRENSRHDGGSSQLNNEKGVNYFDKHFSTQATSLLIRLVRCLVGSAPRCFGRKQPTLSFSAAGCY